MTKNNALIAVIQDIMSLLQIPGTAAIGEALQSFHKNHLEKARETLLKELSQGKIDPLNAANKDETIGVIYQYMQCAARGTAHINLNLLAQAMNGEMQRGLLYPDQFTKYINILSTLTYDEIIAIATYWKNLKLEADAISHSEKTTTEDVLIDNMQFQKLSGLATSRTREVLVPTTFENVYYLDMIFSSLMRTGLFIAHPVTGGMAYQHSPIIAEIGQLIDFERALEEEKEY